jgi:argininosuccinate lyase
MSDVKRLFSNVLEVLWMESYSWFPSEKEYYKFIIIACKENTNKIMELGFISCKNRDDILNGLERIEDDIAKGRFMWRENKDVRSNIVEALDERVGGPARNLDATISQCAQKLTILRLWFHDSADTIVTQIEQLQVELVLLALRNWDLLCLSLFDVPTGFYLAN